MGAGAVRWAGPEYQWAWEIATYSLGGAGVVTLLIWVALVLPTQGGDGGAAVADLKKRRERLQRFYVRLSELLTRTGDLPRASSPETFDAHMNQLLIPEVEKMRDWIAANMDDAAAHKFLDVSNVPENVYKGVMPAAKRRLLRSIWRWRENTKELLESDALANHK
jgi:hypothetical protein